MTTPLPSDLFRRAAILRWLAPSHVAIPAQDAARLQLHDALTTGGTQDVIDALHELARAFQRDVHGHYLPERLNHTTREAKRLIADIEGIPGNAC